MIPTFISPVGNALVVSGWGDDRSYRGGWHEGFDFAVPVGTPVYASASGVVAVSKNADPDPAGEMIAINHDGGFQSRYMHLSKRLVQKGQNVSQGQLIAYSGNTGIARSAPHLHADWRASNEAILSFKQRFGIPKPFGFGKNIGGFIGIPAESIVTGVNLSPKVKQKAKDHGIALAAGVGASVILLIGGAYLAYRFLR